MLPLEQRMRAASSLLAPYAVPHEGILGRERAEEPDATRFPFQRDRDRIIHTQAFRRLKGKTQVFVAGESDHVRTRLTHTMEVAQVSRDIARTLALNEDLTEAIALAHDLGHPPFGHAGEEALDLWMRTRGGRFEHNEQSLRTVTKLEEHSSLHPGLNLNREILSGLEKHRSPYDHPSDTFHSPLLEAQVTNLADEIAYTGHDVDDGLSSGLFPLLDLRKIALAEEAASLAHTRGTSIRGAIIHLLVMDLYAESKQAIERSSVASVDDVRSVEESLILFSPDMEEKLNHLRMFLWNRLYSHPRVQQKNAEGQDIIRRLIERCMEDPPKKVLILREKTKSTLPEAVKDYIAGMTDAYAASF